jgi:DNA-binding GntR family transcriptional regulator
VAETVRSPATTGEVDGRALHRPRGEAVGRVVAELREAILTGALAPGEKIRQVELARRFHTSRLPVREALRQLHHEGLIALVPNAGARVAEFNVGELEEIYRLREVIEPMLIRDSAPNLGAEDVDSCRRLAREMEELAAADGAKPQAWLALDREFHRTTFNGTKMRHALRLVQGLWNMVAHYRLMYARLPGAYEFTHLEHRLLVDALERRNGDDAALILELHIRRTRLGLEQRLAAGSRS